MPTLSKCCLAEIKYLNGDGDYCTKCGKWLDEKGDKVAPPTLSNEEELKPKVYALIKQFGDDYQDRTKDSSKAIYMCVNDLLALFATQNTALLKEVIGADIPKDFDDELETIMDWEYYTDYKVNANDFVIGYNKAKAEMRSKLAAMGEQ